MLRRFLSITVLSFLAVLFLSSCSGGSGGNSSDGNDGDGGSSDARADMSRPQGWTSASHGDNADPNYNVVFQQGVVLRLDLTIDSADWQAMLDDMTDLYGEFGSRPGPFPGGDFGDGGPPPDFGDGGPPPDLGDMPDQFPGGGQFPGMFGDENPVWKPCTLQFKDKTWYHVGVRFKGQSSLLSTWGEGVLKLPFRFDFDQFEDEYPEIDDQRFYGFKKLTLSSNFSDDSFLREKVVADLFRDAGVPAPKTAFYRLYIDYGEGKEYFGLYTMVEVPHDPMLGEQFLETGGNLYKPETSLVTYNEESFDKETNKDEADYSDVLALYNALHSETRNTNPLTWKAGLEEVFDVDGFLRWLAVNTLIENWDTYGRMAHNYYLYNDPGDGLLHWIPWDNNLALRSESGFPRDDNEASRPNPGRMQPLSLDLTSEEVNDDWPLIRYLVDDEEYWAQYVSYVKATRRNVFYPARMKQIYKQAHELIRPYTVGVDGEMEGYTLLSSPEAFDTELEYLNDHVERRHYDAMIFGVFN